MKKGPSLSQARRVIEREGERAWVELVRQHGHTWSFQGSTVTAHPPLVHELLSNPRHTEQRPVIYKLFGKIPGTDGVLFHDGESWRERLSAVMPVFNKAHVDTFARHIHDEIVTHFDRLADADAPAPDLFDELMRANLRVGLRVGFGLDPDDPRVAEFGQRLYDFKLEMYEPRYRLDAFGLSPSLLARAPGVWRHWRKLKKRAAELERSLPDLLEHAEPAPMSWLARLASTSLDDGALAAESNHVYGAYNAIDYVLACALHELYRHPEWVARLRAERASVLGDRANPERGDLTEMPAALAFMKETLRRYPVSLSLARQVGEEPVDLDGLRLEPGAQVLILLHALHHDPETWDDPYSFDPQRWLDMPPARARALEHGHYLPFVYGRRKCIGRQLAELQFVVVVDALVSRFDLSLDHSQFAQQPFMIPRLAHPIPTRVTLHDEATS